MDEALKIHFISGLKLATSEIKSNHTTIWFTAVVGFFRVSEKKHNIYVSFLNWMGTKIIIKIDFLLDIFTSSSVQIWLFHSELEMIIKIINTKS